MSSIYDQHQAAFQNVSAYVILKNGERVATIAFKFPRDGAGRLYCYLHIFGASMCRGHANGYGYDKKSAAAESAAARHSRDTYPNDLANIDAIKAALAGDSGWDWDHRLRDAGFDVVQAV
jgi:hypothetical protein